MGTTALRYNTFFLFKSYFFIKMAKLQNELNVVRTQQSPVVHSWFSFALFHTVEYISPHTLISCYVAVKKSATILLCPSKQPPFGCFLTNYDVTRLERRTAELIVINSTVQKRAQNREKIASGDYSHSNDECSSPEVMPNP